MALSTIVYHEDFDPNNFTFMNPANNFSLEFPHIFNAISAARAMSSEMHLAKWVIAFTDDIIRKPERKNSRKRAKVVEAIKVFACQFGEVQHSFKVDRSNILDASKDYLSLYMVLNAARYQLHTIMVLGKSDG